MYVQRNKTFSVLLYYQSDKGARLSDTAASKYIKLWVRYTLQASLKLHCIFEGAKIAVKFHWRREKKLTLIMPGEVKCKVLQISPSLVLHIDNFKEIYRLAMSPSSKLASTMASMSVHGLCFWLATRELTWCWGFTGYVSTRVISTGSVKFWASITANSHSPEFPNVLTVLNWIIYSALTKSHTITEIWEFTFTI